MGLVGRGPAALDQGETTRAVVGFTVSVKQAETGFKLCLGADHPDGFQLNGVVVEVQVAPLWNIIRPGPVLVGVVPLTGDDFQLDGGPPGTGVTGADRGFLVGIVEGFLAAVGVLLVHSSECQRKCPVIARGQHQATNGFLFGDDVLFFEFGAVYQALPAGPGKMGFEGVTKGPVPGGATVPVGGVEIVPLIVTVTDDTGTEPEPLATVLLINADSGIGGGDLFPVVFWQAVVVAVPGMSDPGVETEPVRLLDLLGLGSAGGRQQPQGDDQWRRFAARLV